MLRRGNGTELWSTDVTSTPTLGIDIQPIAEVWTMPTGGGVNGWLGALDDRLIVPVGNGDPPSLVAVGLRE